MARTFDAVIFDLDGTLVDSLGDIAAAMNHALVAHGFPTHPVDAYRQFVGEGVRKLAERATPEGTSSVMWETVLTTYRAFYKNHSLDQSRPFPGIVALTDALVRSGRPMAVLSNKADDFTRDIVAGLFRRGLFQCVYGERVGVPRKPDPTSALAVAAELGVAPERCAFVGDTAVDMNTAQNAGMCGVGVTWGFRGVEELEEGGAVHVVASADALSVVLLGEGPWRRDA